MPQLKITLIRSTICTTPKHRRVVKALGLGKLHSSVIQPDNAATRGSVHLVRHLVRVETVEE